MKKRLNLVWQNTLNNKSISSKLSESIKSPLIKEVIKLYSQLKDQVIVIKVPSIIIQDDKLLNVFSENISLLNKCGAKVFLVHDYSNLISSTLSSLGFNQPFTKEVKYTGQKNMQIVEMVLSGYISKRIVSKLCQAGCNAIGISGKDGNFIEAKKPKVPYIQDLHDIIDITVMSEPAIVNPELLLNFEEGDLVPVITPIALDTSSNTHLLNTNLTAAIISNILNADSLILDCEDDILANSTIKVNDNNNVLYKILASNEQNSDLVNLVQAALEAIQNNTQNVHFINPKVPDSILTTIFDNN